ncbi:hypothetical protein MES5069_450025 [Mesorhizobium escarrei]|uniref:Transposase domain-containing protein n=1 Tax=Mesorhizobium escarrei TaxID=666018 RepID=A0ABN8K456_9HYPH|nr:hypothetical protein MES5069_450025 [Mesorhizobium escarrei]
MRCVRKIAALSSPISNLGCAEKLGLISQRTKLAGAIRYTLSRWKGPSRFLDDGRIEIDSNVVERSIFAGSDGGAQHWAVIASLIETCKLSGVEPLGYLADVLTSIVNRHPNSQIDDLLPWAYIRLLSSRPWPENSASGPPWRRPEPRGSRSEVSCPPSRPPGRSCPATARASLPLPMKPLESRRRLPCRFLDGCW